jgi:DNA invertase Pin-like site-specific DNA recombinase
MKRAAFYARVSTDQQTVENQLQVLQEVAARSGWIIVATYTDEGISGAKGRDQRPGLDALLKAVARREIDIVMAWSVDRLGRAGHRRRPSGGGGKRLTLDGPVRRWTHA